jgi:UDP-hydrolysing UDP-N-acetyl-D-glucosamine 2-epimerase|tara:strand:+ start:27687 stop:28871 length:1185 start_codon:yes stop_codon:yes gene_type:complete
VGKKRIAVVVASRANYGRIKSVLQAVDAHPGLELQLIVGASSLLYRYGQVVDRIEADGFRVAARSYMVVEGENPIAMAKSTGLGIVDMATHFDSLKPDVVLTVADRYETMATAIAASYMNIPLAHTQGGEVTGSIDESVRHAITKLAHIHFVTTPLSRQRLIQLGEDPTTVHITGCPSIDAIQHRPAAADRAFFARYGGTGTELDPSRPYIVVLQHPVTTEFGKGLDQIQQTINAVSQLGTQIVWLWPNIDAGSDDVSKGLRMFANHNPGVPIHFYRNFDVADYATLIENAACLVGNSSSGLREGAYLGVPVVNVGTRQTNREVAANVLHADYDAAEIEAKIRVQIEHGRYPSDPIYGDGRAGHRIADLLASENVRIQKSFRDLTEWPISQHGV